MTSKKIIQSISTCPQIRESIQPIWRVAPHVVTIAKQYIGKHGLHCDRLWTADGFGSCETETGYIVEQTLPLVLLANHGVGRQQTFVDYYYFM